MLDEALKDVRGIGAKKAALLQKLGLHTVRDMLFYLPRDYKDFSQMSPAAALQEGERCALLRLSTEAQIAYPRRGLSIVTAEGMDETGRAKMLWYNQPFRKKQLEAGRVYLVYGRVRKKGRIATFENPDIEAAENIGEGVAARGILPIYPLTAGVGQKSLRSAAKLCLERARAQLPETLETPLRNDHRLCELNYAVEQIHFPTDQGALSAAKQRLCVEELLYFMMAVEWMKATRLQSKGIAFATEGLLPAFLDALPFEATAAQKTVLAEIDADMRQPPQMNRMVQGDVGAGKTVLALYALFVAWKNGWQGVLMAPTEILARQHAQSARHLFGGDARIDLLTGSLTPKQRKEALARLAEGSTDIAIGTHALIQEDVAFARLGVVIADEQHRFGVRQRAALAQGSQADILIMSATPIPRTMTMVLYGDLDISVLSGLPPGRKPVKTHLVPAQKREDLYHYVAKEARQGRQSYVVCPLVEASEELQAHSAQEVCQELKQGALKEVAVGLLHGKMRPAEKDEVLQRFREGDISVLVSTTVIEVGVDVPNACIMVIESAERFGLAQLHQLRGRVGRGALQSWCFLLPDSDKQEAQERLRTLCESHDGFAIAQRDLELRGPGEFLGTRQSGSSWLSAFSLAADMQMLEQAQQLARDVIRTQRDSKENQALWEQVQALYGDKLTQIAMN